MSMTYDEALETILRRIIREEIEKALKERAPYYVPVPHPTPTYPQSPWTLTFTSGSGTSGTVPK
jgi:hypothetical protein